ncbi:MFS transporter [Novispirillum itersonii]|uniref:MFS transporter n=1 Tax=Novispirillum itersonii TaxID=189 RepID=UPI00037BA680|nr:MFS transporter [Novispirillum itersonii]
MAVPNKGSARDAGRETAAAGGPSPWLVLAVTTVMQALISGAALTPPVFATKAAADIGFDSALVGFYTSLVYLGAMLATLFAGSVVSTVGAMRVSQICLLLSGAGLWGLASGLAVPAVIAALVIGFGYGPATPASSHMLARTTPPERRGLIFSIKQTGVPLGGVLAGTAVPWLVLSLGWQAAAGVIGAAAVVLAVLVQPLRPPLDRERQRKAGALFRRSGWAAPLLLVWGRRDLRMMALASFCFAAVQLSFSAYLVTYLVDRIGYPLIVAGGIFAAAQVAGSVGRIVWGALADHWFGARKMLTILSIVMTVTASGCAFFSSEWPVFAVSLVALTFGASAIGWNGVFLAEVAHLTGPADAARATGGALAFTYAGVVCGPSLFGVMISLTGGYVPAFLSSAVVAALGGLLVLMVRSGKSSGAAGDGHNRKAG